MKLTACWITKNEEATLARSIESLGGIADELLVVDTGSDDGTVELARSLGARVESFEWIGDFSAARNHAISLAEGDILFFLDADEWFVPALTGEDRRRLEGLFTKDEKLEAIQLRIVNLDEQCLARSSFNVDRIFRKSEQLRYQNRIHERLVHTGGRSLHKLPVSDRWEIWHTGYQSSIVNRKMARNIEMLEQALESTPENDPSRFMQKVYLMREHKLAGHPERSEPYLQEMLRSPGMINAQCREYRGNFIDFLYLAMDIARSVRDKISRKAVRQRMVGAMIKHFPAYRGTATVDLLYQAWFDLKEDRLIEELPKAFAAAERLSGGDLSRHKEAESHLFYYAARAHWRRGRRLQALEHAVKACSNESVDIGENLRILLDCVRGQPVQEIADLLYGLYDFKNPQKLDFLIDYTRLEAFRDLNIGLVGRQIDMGNATKGTFLYLQLMLGKYEESARFALTLEGEENVAAAAKHLFMTAVITGEERYYKENAELLSFYGTVLDAFFRGEPLAAVTNQETVLLEQMYHLIAFAGGIEAAERLRRLYVKAPALAYRVKAGYCLNNGLYELLLDESTHGLSPDDVGSLSMRIQALLLLGRCREALSEIDALLTLEAVDGELLLLLSAVADSAPDETGGRARRLYLRFMPVWDLITDLQDILATGMVFDEYTKKQMAAFRTLSMQGLEKMIEEDSKQPAPIKLLNLYQRAAAFYEKGGMYGHAFECCRWLAAHHWGGEETNVRMALALERLGNHALAGKVMKIK